MPAEMLAQRRRDCLPPLPFRASESTKLVTPLGLIQGVGSGGLQIGVRGAAFDFWGKSLSAKRLPGRTFS